MRAGHGPEPGKSGASVSLWVAALLGMFSRGVFGRVGWEKVEIGSGREGGRGGAEDWEWG